MALLIVVLLVSCFNSIQAKALIIFFVNLIVWFRPAGRVTFLPTAEEK
jgi:hypothetical protein